MEPLRRELRTAGARLLVVTGPRDALELAGSTVSFDAAWIELEAVAGIDLPSLGREVARVLRPGGRLVCVVPGAFPLRRLLARALRGRGERPDGASFTAWRRSFGATVSWRRARGFGILVPEAESGQRLPPLSIGLLAAAEHVLCRWPLLRALGERALHEGVRR
ncbi:MAG TPA: class I SAM-dependent methyltransferase [Vicinamibacteria bacterium]|nr:class I SAM-dependent methyltransferase [Vicinamibacteria bacterium]